MTASDKSYFDSKFSTVVQKVENLERGVYGDTKNKQKGLVESDADKEARIKSLEKKWDRVMWIAAGIGMASYGTAKLLESIIKQITL